MTYPTGARFYDDHARFWSKVDKSGECWEWTAGKNKAGYGRFKTRKGTSGKWGHTLAHRYAWMEENGPIPAGIVICHHCDNPGCVRPSHLFAGTMKDNQSDMARKKRSRHGENHPYTKITNNDVLRIRSEYVRGNGVHLAKRYGISKAAISRIVNGVSYRLADPDTEKYFLPHPTEPKRPCAIEPI